MTCRRAEITGRWDVIALIVVLPRWLAHRASLHACSAPAQLWSSGHHWNFNPFAAGGGLLGKMRATLAGTTRTEKPMTNLLELSAVERTPFAGNQGFPGTDAYEKVVGRARFAV